MNLAPPEKGSSDLCAAINEAWLLLPTAHSHICVAHPNCHFVAARLEPGLTNFLREDSMSIRIMLAIVAAESVDFGFRPANAQQPQG
jgi:hypothetical protein